ncbi:MAG: exopolysaccharide biosynthesis protein [Alphaproteobacteria bacterium]|nr:exopolysaccharide biosynthesis protein [Alphaproteobacteria bacterium]
MDQHKIITTQVIEDVVNSTSSDRVPIRDLVYAMESVGFGLVMMIFALAITIPTPPPLPSIISVPLIVFSLQMMLGYSSPKLPKRFADLTVKRSVLATLVNKSAPYIRKIELILKPRLAFMTTKTAERLIGFFSLLFSSFILLPIPLSNFIPGLGILITSFGLLGKDGLVVLLGITVGIFGITVSIATVMLGVEVVYYFLH